MTARQGHAAATLLALAGLVISVYLAMVRLAGELPVCGPVQGCEAVALSSYSELAGVPIALLGVGFSAVLLALQVAWWSTGSRAALMAAYGLGLFGVVFVAYLTYVELFVIHAVCAWCVAYGLTVVTGWVVAAVALADNPLHAHRHRG